MGYSIQPVTIWQDGKQVVANTITAIINYDDLQNNATFYWYLTNSNDNEIITKGNTSISGADYDAWGASADINLAAYQYICSQLNLTLIP
jgi:hypothetical protein